MATAPRPAFAERTLLILDVPGLRAEDLTDPTAPAFRALAEHAAVGLLNTRTADTQASRADVMASGHLTVGAGTRAAAFPCADARWRVDLARIHSLNALLDHPVPLGALGDICRQSGLSIEVIGDADDIAPRRDALLLAMDSQGAVDRVQSTDVHDPAEPYGLRSDVTLYRSPKAGCLTVWFYADLARASSYARHCTPTMARDHRVRALARLNTLIAERLIPESRRLQASRAEYQVWVLSPAPDTAAPELDRLTPVALMGSGVRPGWLTSPSTRRQGLILNTDILPTIARLLGTSLPAGATGRAVISSGSGAASVERWKGFHTRQLQVATEQFWLGTMPSVRMAFMLIAAGGVALWVLWRNASARRFGKLVAVAAAGVMLIAVTVQALSALFSPTGLTAGIILLAACSAGGLILAIAMPRSRTALADLSCIILAVGVPATMLLAPDRLPNAWISYGAMFGTRLYGIGNEMAGAWLGATVLAVAPLLRPPLHRVAFGVLAICAFLAALPAWGANLGAGLAFAVAAAYAVARQGSPRVRTLKGLAVALILIGCIAILLRTLDRGSGASHLGRALTLQQPLMQIALRKVTLNVHTILHSTWTVTVLGGLLCGELIRRKSEAPFGSEVFALLWVAAAAILVFNDTGIVAAGLSLATAVPALTLRSAASPP